MKTQRRHDLKSNELSQILQQARAFFAESGSKVLAVVLVLVLLVAVGVYLSHSRTLARQESWSRMYAVMSGSANTKASDLRTLARQSDNEKLAALALKAYADMSMRDMVIMPATPDQAQTVKDVEAALQSIISDYGSNTFATAGARVKLGIVYENSGKWQEARAVYQKLSEDESLTGFVVPKLAADRLKDLARWQQLAKQVVTTAPATKPAS